MLFVLLLCLVFLVKSSSPSLCDNNKIQKAGRIVFGEARGEIENGQLAVAYTIVNRVNSNNNLYPRTFQKVVDAQYTSNGRKYHEYNTLDDTNHDTAWSEAKNADSTEYKNAIKAAKGALCGTKSDPSNGATAYCAYDPCSATKDNKYSTAKGKIKIGNHWFVQRVPKK